MVGDDRPAVADFLARVAAHGTPDLATLRPLAPAALPTWRNIAGIIGLADAEALAALGGAAPEDVARWTTVRAMRTRLTARPRDTP